MFFKLTQRYNCVQFQLYLCIYLCCEEFQVCAVQNLKAVFPNSALVNKIGPNIEPCGTPFDICKNTKYSNINQIQHFNLVKCTLTLCTKHNVQLRLLEMSLVLQVYGIP